MASLVQALGRDLVDKITRSKILVIGAGGIGCELLKNVVLTGFVDIEIIDLDTIDPSNLNRQFLFRPHHVGKPKAIVAREAAMAFNPTANIVARHANVKDKEFGVEYFRRFAVVLIALDNESARRHVNRMCLAANTKLVEAGTSGYQGQAYPIQKGVTACFECNARPVQKQFPICTIRSTPDKPVHCVVWAKELHKLLFGDSKSSFLFEGQVFSPAVAAGAELHSDAGSVAPTTPGSSSAYMPLVLTQPAPGASDASVREWATKLTVGIFHDDIEQRLSFAAESYKTAKHKPIPVDVPSVLATPGDYAEGGSSYLLDEQQVLTPAGSLRLFINVIMKMYASPETRAAIGSMEFTKDSPLDVDFVTGATNMRAFTFGIPLQSRFDVKSIAGNIIPAIAASNAMVAGFQVLEAIKMLRGDDVLKTGRVTYLQREPNQVGLLFSFERMSGPNPKCMVCGAKRATAILDTSATTLRTFVEKVLKGQLGFNNPAVDNKESLYLEMDDVSTIVWDTTIDQLAGGGLRDGTLLSVLDFDQDLEIELLLVHRARTRFDELKHPDFLVVFGDDTDVGAQIATLDEELASLRKPAALIDTPDTEDSSIPEELAGMKRKRG